jgi:hypothetical protein
MMHFWKTCLAVCAVPVVACVAGPADIADVNMVVRDSYLPGIPVLVRVELLDEAGAVLRDRWDATAVLSVDNPVVHLSPNSVRLYNGLGSALVTFTSGGDFLLTADVNGVKTTAALADWTSQPVRSVSGTLGKSTTWSGVYRITADLTIAAGVTLTLQPGTLVLIDGVKSGGSGKDIEVQGAVQSLGTAASPVTFTASVPGQNWGEMRFTGAELSTFDYTVITHAGRSPGVGHTGTGPAIRAQDSQIVFDHVSLTDHAGKVMHTVSGCDLVFRHCLLARSVMGPEIASTALLFEAGWITEMHANDDADGIYIHSQQAGQSCVMSQSVIADVYDDGIDTLGSQITVQDCIIRNCKDKGASIYDGEVTLDHCLIVENNAAPEDPTVASVVAKTLEGSTATVNIEHTTIVTARTAGYTDAGIQAHNKYGVAAGRIYFNVTNSIIDASDGVSVQAPYLALDILIDHSDVTGEAWPGTGNLHADPLFVDEQNHNYHLRADSPCIGAAEDKSDLGYYSSPTRPVDAETSANDPVWTAANSPYHISGEFVVPADGSLTIEPGVSVHFDTGARMIVNGRLVAEGSEDNPILFTRTPGSQGTWAGVQFVNSAADNRIAYALLEYGRTNDGMVGVEKSRLLLDHVTFDHTDLRRVRVLASWLTVRDCTFMDMFGPTQAPTTDNMSEHIWGSVVDGGELIVDHCVFGMNKGHNDAVDVDGNVRPKPPIQILNSTFLGGGDDALDLEGDAHIEGNLFTNFHKDRYNTAARQSNVISAGAGKYYVVVRNVFYNCDHAAQVKQRSSMLFVNNTVMDATASAFFFEIPGQPDTPGKGVIVDSCIFRNVPAIFSDFRIDDPIYGTTQMVIDHSIVPAEWQGYGEGNFDADPLFVAPPTDFHLKPMSPAVGAGANGLDMGAFVPAGASVSGEPCDITWRTRVTLTVAGPGITHYKYSLNDPNGPWGEERTVGAPIELTDLANGASYQVYVLGKNSAGVWQTVPNASRPWLVDTSYSRLVINELLAWTLSPLEGADAQPDLIELYYDGPNPLDLSGMSVTDDPAEPAKFVFPQGTAMEPGQYLILLAGFETPLPGIHLGFSLDRQGGAVYLYDSSGRLLDSVEYGTQLPDLSIGRVGPQAQWHLTMPTFGQANVAHPVGDPAAVKINEWLVAGEAPFTDGFVELFNPQSSPVDMGALHLTDGPETRNMGKNFTPLTFLADHGFVVLAMDQGDLSMNGGTIILYDSKLLEVDKVIYGPQTPNVSQGRAPDGSDDVVTFDVPTPGGPNPYVAPPEPVTWTLVAVDSVWSYEQDGVALDASWRDPAYDDSSWPAGPGVLYVEESSLPWPKKTPLTLGATTYYFRTHFALDAEPSDVVLLELTALVDDGAVFYLNGQEVYRLGMPAGAVGYSTHANRTVGNATVDGPFEIPATGLQRGDNVLAVEVHQVTATSSDIVFALELTAQVLSPQ